MMKAVIWAGIWDTYFRGVTAGITLLSIFQYSRFPFQSTILIPQAAIHVANTEPLIFSPCHASSPFDE